MLFLVPFSPDGYREGNTKKENKKSTKNANRKNINRWMFCPEAQSL